MCQLRRITTKLYIKTLSAVLSERSVRVYTSIKSHFFPPLNRPLKFLYSYVCLFLYSTEFYGKNNLEATYVDLIFDTFQDLLSKAMPYLNEDDNDKKVLLDFLLTVKAAPHECVIRTSQP